MNMSPHIHGKPSDLKRGTIVIMLTLYRQPCQVRVSSSHYMLWPLCTLAIAMQASSATQNKCASSAMCSLMLTANAQKNFCAAAHAWAPDVLNAYRCC